MRSVRRTRFKRIGPGPTPSVKHRLQLSGYLLSLWRGPKAVRKMIVADIRMWIALGMVKHAADLLIVLRRFLADYPESKFESPVGRILSLSHSGR